MSSLALEEEGGEARLQRPAVFPQRGRPKLAETPHCPAVSSPRKMAVRAAVRTEDPRVRCSWAWERECL